MYGTKVRQEPPCHRLGRSGSLHRTQQGADAHLELTAHNQVEKQNYGVLPNELGLQGGITHWSKGSLALLFTNCAMLTI